MSFLALIVEKNYSKAQTPIKFKTHELAIYLMYVEDTTMI
jgi:hypothetical protein